MEIGDAVQFPMGDDVLIIGEVEDIDLAANTAKVREAHAFHRMWGGSNGARGELHEVSRLDLVEPATARNRRIVQEVLPKWREKNERAQS
jgi:hypothetical protein